MSERRIGLVIVAAGSSQRMQGVDKLWVDVGGVPLLARTIEALATALPEAEAVGVCAPAMLPRVEEKHDVWPWSFVTRWVAGGLHRQDSVYAGLVALDPSCEVVLIHDGARPFVTPAIIEAGINAAVEYGAATAAIAVTDTIAVVDATTKRVTATPDRTTLWAVQTPQVFAYHVIMQAYTEAGVHQRTTVTDDASLVERAGHRVHVFPGSPRNIKVSTPVDLALVRLLWAEQERSG